MTVHASGANGPPQTEVTAGYNNSGADIPKGSAVVWDVAVGDGKGFTLPTTATGGLLAGIVDEIVPEDANTDNIVTHGVVDALVDGTTDVDVGDALKMVDQDESIVYSADGAIGITSVQLVALEEQDDPHSITNLTSVFVNV